jgi:ketosteroid isomerase-like protein
MTQQTALMTDQPSALLQRLTSYFDAVNTQQTSSAASLFCEEGVLVAPLGIQMRGRAAIATYLADQCEGMALYPEQVSLINSSTISVLGRVKYSTFAVQVEWKFHMAGTAIAVLQVRLLASLQQLAHLRNSKYAG